MPDAFDGAGKPFKGASYRALILILVGVIATLIVAWLLISWFGPMVWPGQGIPGGRDSVVP